MDTAHADRPARSRQRMTSYFRCLTCVLEPIRERSHFRTNDHRKQRLCEVEREAWIADQQRRNYVSDAVTGLKHRGRWDTSRREQSHLKRGLKTKSQQYFRCLTCTGHPIRPKSHFRYYRRKMEEHHKQRLSQRERAAWIAERLFGPTQYTDPLVPPEGGQATQDQEPIAPSQRGQMRYDEKHAVARLQPPTVDPLKASAVQDDIVQAMKAKYRQYYRCLTCPGQPIRPKSHFRYHAKRRDQHRRATLSPGDRICWLATKVSASSQLAESCIARTEDTSRHLQDTPYGSVHAGLQQDVHLFATVVQNRSARTAQEEI